MQQFNLDNFVDTCYQKSPTYGVVNLSNYLTEKEKKENETVD